jgi:ubiquinol-cytochrome c reductase iron-sulfur subunit
MGNDAVEERLDDPQVNQGRRRFLTATTAVVGAVGVGFVAVPFIKSWNPSAKAKLAGAPVTQDISALQEGMRIVLEWRGQPIWIVKRTKQMLDVLPTLDPKLRDPKSTNADQQPDYVLKGDYHYRSLKPQISVLVGICTHLGCSPGYYPEMQPQGFDAQWKGGFYCPCHQSRFDLAGRVFQGVPAPSNLAIPPYHFADDSHVVVGVAPDGAA